VPKPEGDKYGFTHWARKLNDCGGVNPLPSDSRRRPDRHALAEGETSTSGSLKYSLEQMQREEKRVSARERPPCAAGGVFCGPGFGRGGRNALIVCPLLVERSPFEFNGV
jgi:Oxysterol-binding protein